VGSRAGLDVFEKRKIFCPYQDLNPGPSSLTVQEKVKNKFHPTTDIQGLQGEYRDSSILSLTSALDRGGW